MATTRNLDGPILWTARGLIATALALWSLMVWTHGWDARHDLVASDDRTLRMVVSQVNRATAVCESTDAQLRAALSAAPR